MYSMDLVTSNIVVVDFHSHDLQLDQLNDVLTNKMFDNEFVKKKRKHKTNQSGTQKKLFNYEINDSIDLTKIIIDGFSIKKFLMIRKCL